MMLTGGSNEPLGGCCGQKAELTPSLQNKSQPVALFLGVGHAVLTPPVEKRSQLTLSAQWSLEEPSDVGLEASWTSSPRLFVQCCTDVKVVVPI